MTKFVSFPKIVVLDDSEFCLSSQIGGQCNIWASQKHPRKKFILFFYKWKRVLKSSERISKFLDLEISPKFKQTILIILKHSSSQ